MGLSDLIKKGSPRLKIKEDMDVTVCKELDGHPIKLDDGRDACLFLRDTAGKPIGVEVTNITPGKVRIRSPETGETIEREV